TNTRPPPPRPSGFTIAYSSNRAGGAHIRGHATRSRPARPCAHRPSRCSARAAPQPDPNQCVHLYAQVWYDDDRVRARFAILFAMMGCSKLLGVTDPVAGGDAGRRMDAEVDSSIDAPPACTNP